MQRHIDDHLATRPAAGEARPDAAIDYPVWRNYRPCGQPEEVVRSRHLQAFALDRFSTRHREDERTYPFPGGFAHEMTWVGVRNDGQQARITSFLVYFVDAQHRVVRLHEYVNSVEVVAVLAEGVEP
jgi:hypothetical protein